LRQAPDGLPGQRAPAGAAAMGASRLLMAQLTFGVRIMIHGKMKRMQVMPSEGRCRSQD
jgi:hypothetical protein